MKEFLNRNKKVLIFFFIVVVAFPFIILVQSPIGIIPEKIGIEIVGYGGSIIGGFIGLIGIYITLHHENNKIRYENKRKVLPLLEIESIAIKDYRYSRYCRSSYCNQECGIYDNDKFEEKYNTMICPLRFYCYFKDCYDNWYRQKAEVSFIFNVQKDIILENRALNISLERGEILSAPEEMDEKLLPWKQGAMICEC